MKNLSSSNPDKSVFCPSYFIKHYVPHLLTTQIPPRCILCLMPGLNRMIEYASLKIMSFIFNTQIFQYDRPLPFSLVYTGIGAPSAVMCLEILYELGVQQVSIIGTCGILDANIHSGEYIIPDTFIREEGTSIHYLPKEMIIQSDNRLNTLLINRLKQHNLPFHKGLHWTTDAPFRESSQKIAEYSTKGCLSVDMESSALFAVAQYYKKPIAALLIGSDTLTQASWSPAKPDSRIVKKRLKLGLKIIIEMFSEIDLDDKS